MADLTQLGVPYPVLLAEYQQRIAKLLDENVMLHAAITHMQATMQPVPQPPLATSPLPQGLPVQQLPDAPPGEPEN